MTDDRGLYVATVKRPYPQLIEALEKLLEEARKGELTGIAYVGVWHGNLVSYSWTIDPRPVSYSRAIIGSIEFLKHDLIARMIDQ
ncbi:MAG TPA: hypothetical protein VF202_15905 [Trueperaceae bacterium]